MRGMEARVREADIRTALRWYLSSEHAEEPDTLIVDELALCQSEARIDVAAINGRLHGYEIKSADDDLARLPHQVQVYNQVLDTVSIVLTARHKDEARQIAPRCWGIIEATYSNGQVRLRRRRKSRQNRKIKPYALAQLLWRPEALAVLEEAGLAGGLRRKPRKVLWQALADSLPFDRLHLTVLQQLKARGDWRSDSRRRPGGGSSPRSAKSLHSQAPPVLLRIPEDSDLPS